MSFCRHDAHVPSSDSRCYLFSHPALQVVAYCHDMGVVHRDLKLENFLLADASQEAQSIKATDFGLSAFYKPGQHLSDVCGTAFYIAPEVLMVGPAAVHPAWT